MKRHAVAPDGSATLDDHERTAGDLREQRERLGGGDGRRDGDGVDDGGGHFLTSMLIIDLFSRAIQQSNLIKCTIILFSNLISAMDHSLGNHRKS